MVGRFGGDEFVVILPETDARSARRVAELLRRRLRGAAPETTKAPVEMSIGTAEWAAGMSAEDLLASADRSLAAARNGGESTSVTGSSPDHAVESIHEILGSVTDLVSREDPSQAGRRS